MSKKTPAGVVACACSAGAHPIGVECPEQAGRPSTSGPALVAEIKEMVSELHPWDSRLQHVANAARELGHDAAGDEANLLRSRVESLRIALGQLAGKIG